eukprot:10233074-Alexandrium_andersonii.AAC.1
MWLSPKQVSKPSNTRHPATTPPRPTFEVWEGFQASQPERQGQPFPSAGAVAVVTCGERVLRGSGG